MVTVHPPETERRNNGGPSRSVERRIGLPSGRAVIGAFLMTLAAVGVFLAYAGASDDTSSPFVVAARPLPAGTTLSAADLETASLDLADEQAGRSFASTDSLVGQRTLDPIGEGELIQASDVSAEPDAGPSNEVTFQLPTSRAVNGDLAPGDLVDVFVTADGSTRSVVRGVPLLGAPDEAGRGDVVLRVALADDDDVVALVHALNTGELTVVRATHATATERSPLEFEPATVSDDEPDADDDSAS